MKAILFCRHPYSFDILKPIRDALLNKHHDFIWYVHKEIENAFPYKNDDYSTSVKALKTIDSQAVFVPGNAVPHYLKGVKVQVFHGLAGEKKSHFKIRHYFDLYLTQGPYFTRKFEALKNKYGNFEVAETGWSKLDLFHTDFQKIQQKKSLLLKANHAEKIILYAPTFSPSLSSAPNLLHPLRALAQNKQYLILIKFHDLMRTEWINEYKKLASETDNIIYVEERNVIPSMKLADIMVSDTSSVVYEFLLLNKPVITFRSKSENISWEDEVNFDRLAELVEKNLQLDPYKKFRQKIIARYHPYNDGLSSERMVEAVTSYIEKNGVPQRRQLNLYRKYTIYRDFKD